MSVLLTHGYFLEEDPKEQEIMKPYPPLGILYISAYLNQEGIENELYDSTFSNQSAWKAYVHDKKPMAIAFYCNLMTKVKVLALAKYIKGNEELKDIVLIGGGPDVRYNAQNYLNEGLDYLVIGEGEQTMAELITFVNNDSEIQRENIDGIAYLNEQGDLINNNERQKVKAIDELPLPNRQGIDLQKYLDVWKKYHGQSAISVSTQRGCPYTCKWCSTAVYGQSYRRRKPTQVVEELVWLKETYNPDTVWFVDDVFTVSHKWLADFAIEVEKAGLDLPFECISRADRMSEEVIELLKRAGCFRIWIGAESGSQKIIDAMDRRVDVNKVREMLRKAKAAGIETGTFIMLGYPGETEYDLNETITHLVESDPDLYTITVAYPIKGTSLYNEIESKLTVKPDWATSTDRDLEFTRTHKRKFYDYAVRKVYNEVSYHKSLKQGNYLGAAKAKAKSHLINLAMKMAK